MPLMNILLQNSHMIIFLSIKIMYGINKSGFNIIFMKMF